MQGNSSLSVSNYANLTGGGVGGPVVPPPPVVAPGAPSASVDAAKAFVTEFNTATVADFVVPPNTGGPLPVPIIPPTDAAVRAAVLAAFPAAGALSASLARIYDAQRSVTKQGKTVHHVPKSDEIVARAAAVMVAAPYGVSAASAFEGDAYKSVAASQVDLFKSYSPLDAAKASAWDNKVDEVRQKLSDYRLPGKAEVIPVERQLNRPTVVSMASFSNYSDELKAAVIRARTPPTSSTQGAMRAISELRVTAVPVLNMAGGSASAHAPLYPRMVMNGGAHPFATLSGGEVEPAAVLQAKIKALLSQYEVITGVPLAGALPAQITKYGDDVNVALKAVKEKLQELSNANAALAQYPLGLGVAAPATEAELKTYAARGAELNKAAERASRKMDKLTEIRDLLQDLVSKQAPAVLAKN